jgi:3-deoxy-D-manno-octulosonate 8-phosphate phosphatase (KDO 8-P phosphatase)
MQNSQPFDIFLQLGGNFLVSTASFSAKLSNIKAFIFDWDGVFNNGSKTDAGSPYSEVDSMGINLLRFGHWLRTGNLPTTAIMTGENNQPAFYLAKRERFQAVYFKFANKTIAFQHFLATHNLQAHEVCFCFDDVLDLSVAALCGLRVLVRRDASPLFVQYVKNQQLADYQTANTGGNFAVREVAELLLGVLGNYEQAVLKRQNFDADYQNYLAFRNSQVPQFFTVQKEQILEILQDDKK